MLTSPATISKNTKQKGFTLIELMVVLMIVGFVVAMVIPRLGKTLGTQLRSATRKIVVLSSELHSFARLRNKTYRLVFEFGDNKGKPSRIYVESASTRQLLAPPDATPPPTDMGDKPPPKPFSVDKEFLKKPIELPDGVYFEDVETDNDPDNKPITEGKAYIHYFPEGLVQHAVIHITNGDKIHWSLVVNPLTGHVDVRSDYVKLKDLEP